jgi:hypothetical protein
MRRFAFAFEEAGRTSQHKSTRSLHPKPLSGSWQMPPLSSWILPGSVTFQSSAAAISSKLPAIKKAESQNMKTNKVLIIGALLAVLGTWVGRAAWRAHRQIVTIDVHNVPLAEVLQKIERQTWKKIYAEKALDGKITLQVTDKPLAYVLDRVCEQAGARWSTFYAVYRSPDALHKLKAALQYDGELKTAGWAQIAPKAPSDDPLHGGPGANRVMPPHESEATAPMEHRPGPAMFKKTMDGQVFIQAGGPNGTELWSPEELVIESSWEPSLGGDSPKKASPRTAAETAQRILGKWTTCLALRKSVLGIGFAAPSGGRNDPLHRGPNDRFARLTPEQRVLQARQWAGFEIKTANEPSNQQ